MAKIAYVKNQSLPRARGPIEEKFFNRVLHTIDGELGKIARVLNNINADNIPDDTITTDHIADDAITADQVADAVIAAEHIATGAIEEAKIAADAVTATKINVAAIHGTTGAIASDHIIAGMLQTDCVEEAKILADAITATKINVSGLDGATGNIATDHIIAGMLQTDCVTEAKVLADAITAVKINVADFINLPSDENLVGYWSFDEDGGTLAVDGSGNGNNGTLTNMTEADWVDGKVGKCLDFDEVDDYVDCGNPSFASDQQGSISFWVYPRALSDSFISYCNPATGVIDEFRIGSYAGNKVHVLLYQSGVTSQLFTPIDSLTLNAWNHIVVTSDGSTTKVYINTVLQELTGTNQGDWFGDASIDANTLLIGALKRSAGTYSLDGKLDEVRIYNRVLTASEIKALYLYPAGNKSVRISGGQIAAATITANELASDCVIEAKILADAITATKINVSGLDGTSGEVAANHIVAGMIQTNAITSIKILADAVTASKINVVGLDGTSGRIIVADVTDADEITGGINTHATTLIAPGKVLISGEVNLDDWSSATDATYIDGGKIYTDTITATQIDAGTITATELGSNCVTSIKILADAITASKINVVGLDGTTGRIIVADTTDADVVTGGINTHATTLIAPGKVLISGAVNLNDWSHASDATYIDGGDVYTNSITATQIAATTITASELATNCVTSIKILADAVTANKINVVGLDGATGRIIVSDATDADEVTAGINSHATTLIAPGKVLISGAVNLDDWSHGTDATYIDGGKVYANSITATEIAALTITAAELAANCITGVKIQADAVIASKINVVGLDGATGRIVVTDQTDADEVTDGINTHAVTLINAGKILISGSTPLSDWSHATDATLIDGGEIYTNSITATQINAGTITADEIHAGTITADELVLNQRMYWYSKASSNPKTTNYDEKSTLSSSYVKLKETRVNEDTGRMNIYFELKSLNGDVVGGRIYKNGVALGTPHQTDSTTYVSFNENVLPFVADDLIQIYAYRTAQGRVYVRNFRLRYDRAVSVVTGIELTDPLVTYLQTVFSVTDQDP